MNTKAQGEITEGVVLAHLLKEGEVVLTPFGDNQRYDLAVDRAGSLIRVQCKTARIKRDAILFSTESSYRHRKRKGQSYKGQADIFGVYCPPLDQVFFISVSDVANTCCQLRLTPTKE